MKKHEIFPTRDDAYNTYIRGVKSYFVPNAARLGISAGNLTIFNDLMTDWGVVYPEYASMDTRTGPLTDEKNRLRKEITAILRDIYNDIAESVLTSDDRRALNLKARDPKPTPIPLIKEVPTVKINSVKTVMHTLKITNPATPQTKAMPYGHKVEVEMAFKTEGQLNWISIGIASKWLFTHIFVLDDVGKTVYYRCRYVNNRGQQGGYSKIVEEIVI